MQNLDISENSNWAIRTILDATLFFKSFYAWYNVKQLLWWGFNHCHFAIFWQEIWENFRLFNPFCNVNLKFVLQSHPQFYGKNIIKMITKGQGTASANIERNWKASPKRADLQTWEVKHPGRQSEKEGVTFPWVQYNGFKSFQINRILILLCFMKTFFYLFLHVSKSQ